MTTYRWVAMLFFALALYPFLSAEFAVSATPGWHTTVYVPWAIASMAMSAWLFLVAIIYLVINKRKLLSNKNIGLHVVFTIMPFVISETQHNWLPQRNEAEAIFSFLILVALRILFAIAQLWFVLLVVGRSIKQKKGF